MTRITVWLQSEFGVPMTTPKTIDASIDIDLESESLSLLLNMHSGAQWKDNEIIRQGTAMYLMVTWGRMKPMRVHLTKPQSTIGCCTISVDDLTLTIETI